ncbi:right-handed parallel beta-helix repeat-containing protein [candidate division KSB1 bacterium]|nr:right-handed parallel beta-helix repeat-containing protein [candidate division KSB1 bacterium]
MRSSLNLLRLFIIIVLFVSSAYSQTEVGGTINQNTTWDLAGSPYIIKNDVTVSGGATLATLTIEPGVVVQFYPERKLIIGSSTAAAANGKLVAVGASDNPILFTTFYDGTNAVNRWRAGYFNNYADDSSMLEYCTFEYSSSAFHIYDSNPTINNCTFRNLSDYGVFLTESSSPTVSNNTFTDLRTAVFMKSKSFGSPVIYGNTINNCTDIAVNVESNDASPQLYENSFTNNAEYLFKIFPNQAGGIWDNTESSNDPVKNKIWLNGGVLSKDATWKETNIDFLVASDVFVKGSGGTLVTLNINPNVTFKFFTGAGLYVGSGILTEPGKLIANQATFTSFLPTPAAGDWHALIFNTSADDASIVDDCIIEYADTGFKTFGASPTFSNNNLSNIANRAVFIKDDASPVVTGNTFDKVQGAVLINNQSTGAPVISNNIISNCTATAIQVDGPNTMPVITDNNFTNNATYLIDVYPNQVKNISGCTESNNTTPFNRIFVKAGDLTQDGTWTETELGYFISGDIIVKAAGNTPTLTIDPGATLYFFNGAGLWVGDVALPATGKLIADQAIFTTYDTNAPAAGKWHAVVFNTTADPASVVDGCTVEYAESAFKTFGSSPTLSNNNISKILNSGVFIKDAAAPALTGNTFTDMPIAVLINLVSTGAPAISNNTFSNCTDIPVKVEGPNAAPVITDNSFSNNATYLMDLFPNQVKNVSGSTSSNTPPQFNMISVKAGDLTQDGTWSETEVGYFISGDLVVKGQNSMPTLTLSPGATLYFFNGAGLWIGAPTAVNAGKLVATGATFTTYDINAQAVGKWNEIYFYDNASDESVLDDCTIEYSRNGLSIHNASPTLENSTIQNVQNFGVLMNDISSPIVQGNTFDQMVSSVILGSTAIGAPVISNNTISNNTDIAVKVNRVEADPLISNNNFMDNESYLVQLHPDQVKNVTGNQFENNELNEIYVFGGFVTEDAVWAEQNVAYYIFADLYVEGLAGMVTLSLDPGVVLVFNNAADLIIGSQLKGLLVEESIGNNSIQTVSDDDSTTGKLLADKVMFTTAKKLDPAPGTWGSIIFKSHASDSSAITRSEIKYATTGIQVNNNHVDISLNTFENCLNYNIYCYGGSPTVLYNTMTGAHKGVFVDKEGDPVINYNNIVASTEYGVQNTSTILIVDAKYNWWGHVSGPAGMGPGSGSPVSKMVDFGGFLTEPFVPAFPPEVFSLLAPADGSTINQSPVTFSWEATTDPDEGDVLTYTLYISTDADFTSPVTVTDLTENSYVWTVTEVNQQYWWKVKAVDTNTEGTWSNETFSFTVQALPPAAFSLLTPVDDDTLDVTDVEFTWEETTNSPLGGALTYTLMLSTDADFTSPQTVTGLTTSSYTWNGLEDGQQYWWKVKAVDENTEGTFSNEVFKFSIKTDTGIENEGLGIPVEFSISQNYPNPFNPVTSIRYGLPSNSEVTITVHNALGQQIEVLVEGFQRAGYHNVVWNAVNYGSGVYFYKIKAGSFTQIRKAILTK